MRERYLIIVWDENTHRERGFDATGRLVRLEDAQLYTTWEEAWEASKQFGGKVVAETDIWDS